MDLDVSTDARAREPGASRHRLVDVHGHSILRRPLAAFVAGPITAGDRRRALADALDLDLARNLEIIRSVVSLDSPIHGREQLTVYRFGREQPGPGVPLLLFAHGGSIRPTPALVGLGLPSLVCAAEAAGVPMVFAALDHRGAGSHEHKRHYCLADRVVDVQIACQALLAELGPRPLVLMGTSMGGHVVSIASRSLAPASLLLSCPAAYSEEAHFARFGPAFTAALRRPESWRGAPTFAALEAHLATGASVALRVSRFDQVIPAAINHRWAELVRRAGPPSRVIETASDHFGTTAEGVAGLLAHLRTLDSSRPARELERRATVRR